MTLSPNISTIIRSLREMNSNPCDARVDLNTPALVTDSVASLDGIPVKRKVVVLRSRGCRWSRTAGCAMCGFFGAAQRAVSAKNYRAQMQMVLETTDFTEYPVLCIFTAGSFLDEKEVSWPVAKDIMSQLGNLAPLKKVIIESCPQFDTASEPQENA